MDPGWDTMEQALPAGLSNLIAVAAVLEVRVTINRMSRDVFWKKEMQRQAVTTQAQLTVGGQVMAERLGRVNAGCCRSWPVSPPGTWIRPTQAHDNKPPCSRRLSGTISASEPASTTRHAY